MASILVRTRKGGKSWELRVKHNLLPKPVYRTYDTKALAEDAGNAALAQLAQGRIPEWLQAEDRTAIKSIGHAIREHLKINPIAPATEKVLTTLIGEIGQSRARLGGMTEIRPRTTEGVRLPRTDKPTVPGGQHVTTTVIARCPVFSSPRPGRNHARRPVARRAAGLRGDGGVGWKLGSPLATVGERTSG